MILRFTSLKGNALQNRLDKIADDVVAILNNGQSPVTPVTPALTPALAETLAPAALTSEYRARHQPVRQDDEPGELARAVGRLVLKISQKGQHQRRPASISSSSSTPRTCRWGRRDRGSPS